MNTFICECERKRAILEKKIAIEEAADRKMDKDIKELEERLARMKAYQENELLPKIAELTVYEDKVQQMVNESDLFQSKEDFIDRCNALRKYQPIISDVCIFFNFNFHCQSTFSHFISVLAQSEVQENDEANLKKLEELRAEIVKTSNEASLVYADMENALTELEVCQ